MNRIITTCKVVAMCVLAYLFPGNAQAQVTTFPYLQDFEASAGGFISAGNTTFAWGAPAGATINSAGSGINAWTTGLTTQYNNNENGYVESPVFNLNAFAAGASPALSLKVWWDSENNWDNTNIKYSTDGGVTFQVLGVVAPNWYNKLGTTMSTGAPMRQDSWNGNFNTGSGGWVSRRYSLAGITGANVIFRIQFSSDISVISGDGFAFDDFSVYDNSSFVDAKAVSAGFPVVSGCGLSGAQPLTVQVQNVGGSTLTNTPVSYSVNGAAPVTETIPGTISPGITASYTFANQVNINTIGTYDLVVTIGAPGDADAANDTTSLTFVNTPVVSTYPYLEDFETSDGNFFTGVDSAGITSFEYGTPVGADIDTAASGTKAWTTNLVGFYSQGEYGYVQSPCFDLSALPSPALSLNIWHNSSNQSDNANIKYSIDGGLTFQVLGSVNDPLWYNTSATNMFGPMQEDSWSGNSNGWLNVRHSLQSVAGQASVIFRIYFASNQFSFINGDGFAFDDFSVFDFSSFVDAKALSVSFPVASGCGLSGSQAVTAKIVNLGGSTLTNMPISYSLNGGASVNEIVAGPINPSDTASYTFNTPVNITALGIYNLSVITAAAGDFDATNDTTNTSLINSLVVTNFPYLEDFELGEGGFYVASDSTTFEYGTPAGSIINSAASGTKAWTTGLTTQYNNSERGYIQSPCFDLSSFGAGTSPALGLKVWWDSENGWDNANIKYSTDGGLTFQLLGVVAPIWYNKLGNTMFGPMKEDSWCGAAANTGSNGWVGVRQSLAGITGTTVIFRIQFSSDGSVVTGDGFAFDDFAIFDNSGFVDATAISASFAINSGCGLSGTQPITTKIANIGGATLTNLPVSYSVNGGTSVTELIAGPINPTDTVFYTFTTQLNVATPNTYNVLVTTGAPGDGDTSNDSTYTSVTNAPTISSFPYSENFELGKGGFYVASDSTTFEYGTPASTVINSAASGTKAWTTGLTTQYTNNERGYVQSPCFNLTSVPNPQIKLKVWWDSENNWDNANIKYSTDGGATFQVLGMVQPNWYNRLATAINGPMKQDSWTGAGTGLNGGSGGWVPVSYIAPSLGGQANVIFRIQFVSDASFVSGDGFAFDDFEVINLVSQLSSFALLTPPTNTILNVVGAPSQLVNIRWQKTNSSISLPITYTWLADAPGGNFANPVLAVPANNNGADTVLTFSYAALNNLLAARSLRVGDTLKFIWTVRATDGTLSRFANAPNFLQVRRGQLVSNVTFKVNMSNEGAVSPNGVHMAGDMNTWTPSSPALVAGAGNVHSVTYTLNVQDTVEYKYLNGNAWGTEEVVPAGCSLPGFGNRFYIVPVQDNATIATVCFARCANCAVATNDVGFGNAISLYPNPTSGNTTLAFNLAEANNLTITLYNAMGETLQVQTERGIQAANIALNTNNLASGVYFVQVNNGNQYAVKQLIIQK